MPGLTFSRSVSCSLKCSRGISPSAGNTRRRWCTLLRTKSPSPSSAPCRDAPSELQHILHRALEKDPEDRYQTVHEMQIDLRRLKKDSTRVVRQSRDDTSTNGVKKLIPAAQEKKRSQKVLLAGAVGLVALAAVAGYFILRPPPAPKLNPEMASERWTSPSRRFNGRASRKTATGLPLLHVMPGRNGHCTS